MKKAFFVLVIFSFVAAISWANFSFYLIDNFEAGAGGGGAKWWGFDNLKTEIVENGPVIQNDLVAESCGKYSLYLSGNGDDWYVGGLGTDLDLDASSYTRFQIDVYGHDQFKGKLLVQFFEDDNGNRYIEQDAEKKYEPTKDDKWEAEVNILGQGFTRVSIPLSAFRDVNPGVGNDKWDPDQKDESGGLLKLQLVAILGEQKGKIDFRIDNLLLSY